MGASLLREQASKLVDILNKVAISPARVTNKQMLAGKVALEIHFPGSIASTLIRVRIGPSRLGHLNENLSFCRGRVYSAFFR